MVTTRRRSARSPAPAAKKKSTSRSKSPARGVRGRSPGRRSPSRRAAQGGAAGASPHPALAYQYKSPNLSLLEKLFLNDFWTWCAERYPRKLAPNVITLTGGACCLTAYCLNWFLSEDLTGFAPAWSYAAMALLMFAYQTLDGSDGKQARRTGSGSALGEMMDHGVDAVVTGWCAYFLGDALGLGYDSEAIWFCVIMGQAAFFLSNLTLLHRGRQTFYPVDVIELQWVMIFVLLCVAYNGGDPRVFDACLIPEEVFPLPEMLRDDSSQQCWMTRRSFFLAGATFGCVSNLFAYSFKCLAMYLPRAVESDDVSPDRQAGRGLTNFFKQMFAISAYVYFAFKTRWILEGPAAHRAFLMLLCFAFGDLMGRLLLVRVSQAKLPLVPPAVWFVMFAYAVQQQRLFLLTWPLTLGVVFFHQYSFVGFALELAEVLGITVLTIK